MEAVVTEDQRDQKVPVPSVPETVWSSYLGRRLTAGVRVCGRIQGPGTGVTYHTCQEREGRVSPAGPGGRGSLSLQAGVQGWVLEVAKWRGREGRGRSDGIQALSLQTESYPGFRPPGS